MRPITIQILAANEVDLGASAAVGGFKGEARYAKGTHAGELIIRTKRVFPSTEAACNAVDAVVEAAKAVADPTFVIEPLSETEYIAALKKQFDDEAKEKKHRR